ncbi:hypothetical protein B0H14DRAFT_2622843 [Mycena olivaceomarginata]|nr:hypothetical protein B0H14DRAFT_2622843 [Mycena olivaceomarginata]
MPSPPPPGLTFEEVLANLTLGDASESSSRDRPSLPAPATPTRRTPTPAIYTYESPTRRGITTSWATAGTATQGVPDAHVHRIQKGPKKKSTKKRAYVVFHGWSPAVYSTWPEAECAVSGFRNAIHRGYATLADAQSAFAYAQARGWIRSTRAVTAGIAMPMPTPNDDDSDEFNPLSGTEEVDNTWFVVYRGIQPGVYRSLLEALLNTTGIPNSLYKTEASKQAAFRSYRRAIRRREVTPAPPPPFTP